MENIGHIKTHNVTIVELATGNENQLDVQSGENMSDGTYVIWCSLNNQEMTSTEDKYFKSFQQFRDKLLEAGYGIKCNGARMNVAPLSKFENGPQVYILESGKKNNPDITVNIWDKADINDFPDSRQQNRFINKWTDEHMGRPEQSRELSKLCLAGFVFTVLPPVLLVLGVLMQELFFLVPDPFLNHNPKYAKKNLRGFQSIDFFRQYIENKTQNHCCLHSNGYR